VRDHAIGMAERSHGGFEENLIWLQGSWRRDFVDFVRLLELHDERKESANSLLQSNSSGLRASYLDDLDGQHLAWDAIDSHFRQGTV
jgi:hypothetical protein